MIKLGYTHGEKWTDELIEERIMNIVNKQELTTFPTHSQMVSFYGNRGLAVKVSKTGGTRKWAKRLNLPLKSCESEFGNDYELLAIRLIKENLGFHCLKTKPRYPYDILVDDNIKIDVKVSYPFKNNCNAYANSFNLEKTEPTCDIYILFCLNLDSQITKTLIIPSCVLSGQTQVGVGSVSKYDEYIDNWILLKQYSEFYKRLIG